MPILIRIIEAGDPVLKNLLRRVEEDRDEIAVRVAEIVSKVRTEGDRGLIEMTEKLDGVTLTPENLEVPEDEMKNATALVDAEYLESLKIAAGRIESFHRKQLQNSWIDTSADGSMTGQLVGPLERAGIYVPGGTASYPSSVLMNAVPAKVAGVEEIIMVTPPGADGQVPAATLAAADLAGVDRVFRVGGAQAIAALAYGTDTIPQVDKITGPGNIYVTLAKQQVYGVVDIDMLAGPSEILIVADEKANPVFVAADLLSQAEHDRMASSVLITDSGKLAAAVAEEVVRQAAKMPRKEIIRASLSGYGAIILTKTIREAVELANKFAPEHLELLLEDPFSWLGKVKNAGSVFLGEYSPEPVGDYLAGPNHILPTGGTARFYSPVSVDTFVKKTGLVSFSREAMGNFGRHIVRLADAEGLAAHANAVNVRLKMIEKKGLVDE